MWNKREHLAKFLKSCVEEMKLVAYALGKSDLMQIDRRDLVSLRPGTGPTPGCGLRRSSPVRATSRLDGGRDTWEFTKVSETRARQRNRPAPYH